MKRIVYRIVVFCLIFTLVFSYADSYADAKIPSPSRQYYAYDEAKVLSLTTEDHIITENERLYAKCGAQIVVACVNSTGNHSIADYAYRFFNKWEIGSKKEQNGVLILLSIGENDYYALQGKGLENLLSSGTLKLMLDDYLEPYFSVGEYDEGVVAVFDAVLAFIKDIYSLEDELPVVTSTEPIFEIDDLDLDSLIQDAVDHFTSVFFNLSIFKLIGKLFSGTSKFFKVAAIVVLVILLLRLLGKKNRGGGGRTRG